MSDNRKRKREIRALMAKTGLKYTQAMRQVDEEWARTRNETATVTTTPGRALADSLATHMDFPNAEVRPVRSLEEYCCGDPTNLDGNAHPWTEVDTDDHGTHYRCDVCGATDTD